MNPISHDPSTTNPDFPAAMANITLNSHGSNLNGVMYQPSGEGLHPTMLLLHGFPGYERNFDLAQIIRRAGWNVLVFHYRGAWGSSGNYRFQHVLEDVVTALEFLRSDEASTTYRVDRDSLVLAGHSLGGWATLITAARGYIQQAIAIAAANLGIFGQSCHEDTTIREETLAFYESSLRPLAGVTAQDLMDETLEHYSDWNPMNHAASLSKCRLLIIAASRDEGLQPDVHHLPLIEALQAAGAEDVTDTIIDSDHSFSDKRIALAQTILDWLP